MDIERNHMHSHLRVIIDQVCQEERGEFSRCKSLMKRTSYWMMKHRRISRGHSTQEMHVGLRTFPNLPSKSAWKRNHGSEHDPESLVLQRFGKRFTGGALPYAARSMSVRSQNGLSILSTHLKNS